MTETLTPERILEATEEVLRRYGPAKATVVDVARALGVSHGSVYRHFPTKAALRGAVIKRWLDRTAAELESVVADDGPAGERLDRWLTGLFEAKRHKAGDDPELFATYQTLIGELGGVVDQHITDLEAQLARIIEDGRAQGEFAAPAPGGAPGGGGPEAVADSATAARAVFQATAHYHDPVHAPEWTRPGVAEAFRAVRELVQRGLRA
jgi:AcrR family transcriptional regulator